MSTLDTHSTPWSSYVYGPCTALGLGTAALITLLDQVSKLWLLFWFGLAERGVVAVAPGVDLVLIWNHGISYGLFQQDGRRGRWLLLAITALAVVLLWGWLARASAKLAAASLGLIIGGAAGNAIDRLVYGAVADFVRLHLTTASFSVDWYVFNLADVAIVAGVIGLLYDTVIGSRAAKSP
jgi:signal peptidase II